MPTVLLYSPSNQPSLEMEIRLYKHYTNGHILVFYCLYLNLPIIFVFIYLSTLFIFVIPLFTTSVIDLFTLNFARFNHLFYYEKIMPIFYFLF